MTERNQIIFIVILIISLASNLFLGGFLFGKFLNYPHDRFDGDRMPPPPMEMMGGPPVFGFGLLHSLPSTEQEKFLPLLTSYKEKMHAQFKQVEQAREAVFKQLSAESFDAKALSTTLNQLQTVRNQIHDMMSQFLVTVASQVSAEERQTLAQSMHRAHPPHPTNRRFDPFDDRGPPLPPKMDN